MTNTCVASCILLYKIWLSSCLLVCGTDNCCAIEARNFSDTFGPLLGPEGDSAIKALAIDLEYQQAQAGTRFTVEHTATVMARVLISNAKDERTAEELQAILNEILMSKL
jgi:hypothetical protein